MEQPIDFREKFTWLDCAKAIGIFGVVLDHTNGI